MSWLIDDDISRRDNFYIFIKWLYNKKDFNIDDISCVIEKPYKYKELYREFQSTPVEDI